MPMRQPSADMQAVLDRLAREDADLVDPTSLDPQLGRALATLVNMRWNTDLPDVARADTVIQGGLPARRIVPPVAGEEAILYVHGGGFCLCSAATHEGAARRLAIACGATVLVPEYRLAPEYGWPAGLEDVLRCWQARDRSLRWGLAGDSAGATLALAATLRLLDDGGDIPKQLLLFYGVYDANFATPSYREHAHGPGLTRSKMMAYWDNYAEEAVRTRWDVAPLRATDAQLRALPPLYLSAAGIDVLRSDTERLARRLAALGRTDEVEIFEGVVHGFMQMGSALPEACTAFARAGRSFSKRAASNRPQLQGEKR